MQLPKFLLQGGQRLVRFKSTFCIFLAVLAAATSSLRAAESVFFDFGAAASATPSDVAPAEIYWNNVGPGVGSTDDGLLEGLITTNNTVTTISLQMMQRFNAANEDGTQTGNTEFPVSATRDSLYGNTGIFNNIENIFPKFKLTGLTAGQTYTFSFYASRMNVGDNRETRYTVTGATETFVDLNVANNVTTKVTVTAMAPDANNEITIALTPGPNNNNGATLFIYLGILQIETSTQDRIFIDFGGANQTIAGGGQNSPFWNNVTETVGTSSTATLGDIVTTNGTPNGMTLAMISRFNGANTAGTTASTLYPSTATQDSLFGNIETFGAGPNMIPEFKLTGLDPNNGYSFTFYGSRAGVTDNRQTRYTVTGLDSDFADLNASANVDNVARVSNIRPTAAGEISIKLTAGPANNNGNHFTYLGVMQIDYDVYRDPQILIDFGAGNVTTSLNDPNLYTWNNVTTTIGGTSTGTLPNLLLNSGLPSGYGLQMVSRFNGANENGTQESTIYPINATRDSLFGNTGDFSGLANVTPIFKLTGLNPSRSYKLTFYASRTGVGDNRETRYTVTGSGEASVDYNPANNIDEVAVLENQIPNAAGELQIALAPGPNNNNGATLFVYLGVLQIDWNNIPVVRPTLSESAYANGSFSMRLTGAAGKTYKIERTSDFTSGWSDTGVSATLDGTGTTTVTVPQTDAYMFYRAVQQP